jgi:hypothetical protein
MCGPAKTLWGTWCLKKKAWYVVVRNPKQKKWPEDKCWVHLTGVLVDHCNELLWYIFHTCENHKEKDLLVEKLDEFIDIRTGCIIREVGSYMKVVFNIEDEDNWMLHSLPK